jgi:putative addiction module killer protein
LEKKLLKSGHYEILTFQTDTGEIPYLQWLERLNWETQVRIVKRVARMERGQFGDCKALAGGLYELRLFFGPSFRVYFGEYKGQVILLINGGDKSSQRQDIKKAQKYWETYLKNNL